MFHDCNQLSNKSKLYIVTILTKTRDVFIFSNCRDNRLMSQIHIYINLF